jgi:hypothetical protein
MDKNSGIKKLTIDKIFQEKNEIPGPGHYNVKSNFDQIKYMKSMDDNGNYI